MFGFCQIGTSKCGFIWIGKKLFHFDFEQKKIINEFDFDAHIIDVKREKEVTALLVNRDLIIVVDDKFDERKKFDLIRRPTSLKLIDGICYVADRSGDVYEIDHQTSQQQKSPERVGEKEEQKPILGHCSNLLQIEVDAKFIYTAEQDEKVRISLRSHPFVIENYLLGHIEFISSFKLSNTNPESIYYSTSGDGTCIKWQDGQINQQTNEKDQFIAHSLALSDTDMITLGLQSYTNPLDSEAEIVDQKRIVFYDSNLTELLNIDLGQCYPLASFWLGTQCYWLIENESKEVSLCLYEINNGEKGQTIKCFSGISSERDPEQWDKLRKVQPKNEFYDEYLKKRKEGFKQSRMDHRGKKRKREKEARLNAANA